MKNSKQNNTETHQCDMCGEPFTGESFPVYDENYNKQRIKQCEECYREGLGEIEDVKNRIKEVSAMIERIVPDKEYKLDFCSTCFQMTNHLNGVCQKHK